MRSVVSVLVCLASAVAAARGEVRVIADAPSYIWYYGCGPTSVGMIVGYWDAHGFDGLIPGSNDWDTNQQAVKDMIASPGHIRDYWPYPDREATPEDPYHADDCVADFMRASRGSLPSGASYENLQYFGMTLYVELRGYPNATGSCMYFGGVWDTLVKQIDAGRPMELYVDSNSDGSADHFVAAIGYDATPGDEKYACYNTYDHQVHWYPFARTASGQPYGIRSGTILDPGVILGDADLDGTVSYLDLGILATNYNQTGRAWADGDFTWNGVVNYKDLGILATNYASTTGGQIQLGQPPPLPEPGTMALLAAGAVLLGLCRQPSHARGRPAARLAGPGHARGTCLAWRACIRLAPWRRP